MKALIAQCKKFEKEYDLSDLAEIMDFHNPPQSITTVLGLSIILYKGMKVDRSWDNIKREVIGSYHNYTLMTSLQLDNLSKTLDNRDSENYEEFVELIDRIDAIKSETKKFDKKQA